MSEFKTAPNMEPVCVVCGAEWLCTAHGNSGIIVCSKCNLRTRDARRFREHGCEYERQRLNSSAGGQIVNRRAS